MLGTIESERYWRWAASGKHPVSGDYFRLGDDFPLGKGFADWVERSYPLIMAPKSLLFNPYSWRFWAKGAEGENLACGLVRDIADRVGRPYTILILGYGSLLGWEKHWDLLPWACERTWSQMEGIATRMFRDLKHLEDEIRTVIPPKASWPEYEGLREGMAKDPCDKKIFDDIQLSLSEGFQKTQGNGVLLDLSEKPTKDYHALIQLCHKMTKDQGGEIPKVVFMGGNASKTYLAVFTRPLVTQDFLRLWSIGSEENGKGKEAIE